MASHFASESLAKECVPGSGISSALLLEKLAGGHEKVKHCLDEGMKIIGVSELRSLSATVSRELPNNP